jgi:hypothetical protein
MKTDRFSWAPGGVRRRPEGKTVAEPTGSMLAPTGSSGSSEIRILFAFDPVRRAVLLVAGDKAGNWQRWYDVNIPIAEKRYQAHVADLETREYE